MRRNIFRAVFLGACLSSCTGTSQDSTNATSSGAVADVGDETSYILSQDECDRQAATDISAGNCDAEFNKLVREIEADQGDDG